MTSPFCDTVKFRNVFLYPTEYLTNGIGWNGVHEDITPIITRPDGSKEYRISDHLASLRVSLTNGSPMQAYDYDPWGNLLSGTPTPRRGFNDNEKDRENGLFSLGVRKYEEGRFLSIDPLFEKEPQLSPYVYAGNAPLNYVDPDGLQRRGVASVPAAILYSPDGVNIGIGGAWGGAAGGGGSSGFSVSGGALGTALGGWIAAEMLDNGSDPPPSNGGSGNAPSSGSGSTPPSGGAGGGGLIGGLGAAGAKFAADEAAKRGTSLTRVIESVGMTTRKASEFFGWGNKTELTKSISDFTKESLLQNGWTKEKLVQLARAYNEQVVKAQKAGAENPAGVVRRDQAMELARKFIED